MRQYKRKQWCSHLPDSRLSLLYSHLQIPAETPGLCPVSLYPRLPSPGNRRPGLSRAHSPVWCHCVSQILTEKPRKFSLGLCPCPRGRQSVSLFLCPSLSFCLALSPVPAVALGLESVATLCQLRGPTPAALGPCGPSPAAPGRAHTDPAPEVGLDCQTTQTGSGPAGQTQGSFFVSCGFWNPGDLVSMHMKVNARNKLRTSLLSIVFSVLLTYSTSLDSVIPYIQTLN